MYKPWPRGVYVRYTPAVRNLFVIFPEGQRPEGYITNKLPNIAGVAISENIHRLDMVYMVYTMLNIDEVYMQYINLPLP